MPWRNKEDVINADAGDFPTHQHESGVFSVQQELRPLYAALFPNSEFHTAQPRFLGENFVRQHRQWASYQMLSHTTHPVTK